MTKDEFWYTEVGYFAAPTYRLTFKVKKVIHKEKSLYQFIEIIDTYAFGRMLLLDGLVMVAEEDEYIYHEMLVHPAMVVHPNPKNILIIGGGDGGAAREVLKYEVEKVTIVDIDQRVIEVAKQYFPKMSKGFFDPRVKIVNADGALYVKENVNQFDIIFVDSTSPIGLGAVLIDGTFLGNGAKSLASAESIWIAQTESIFKSQEFLPLYVNKLKKLFPIVKPYRAEITSYGGGWTFTFASQKTNPLTPKRKYPPELKYYNSEVHQSCFILPEYLRSII